MEENAHHNHYLSLVAILTAPFLVVFGTFSFNIAAPSIQGSLHTTNAELQIMLASYIISYAAFLITGGRLGDIYGRKRIFIFGMTAFALVSICLAVSPSPLFFIIMRILQGFAASLMYPQTLSLIQVRFVGKYRTFALSMFGVTLGLASICAQLIGGAVIQANFFHLSWRPLFLLNVPLGIVAILLALWVIPESRVNRTVKLDLGGAGLAMAGLFSFVLPLAIGRDLHWPLWSIALFFLAVFILILLVAHEKRLARAGGSPLVDLNLFRLPSFLNGLLATLALYAGQVSFFFIFTLYLQHGLSYSPLQAGLTFSPLAIGFFVASLFSSKLVGSLGRRVLMLGSAILAMMTVLLTLLAIHHIGATTYLVLPLLMLGVGFGMIIPPLLGVILEDIPVDYAGSASGVLISTQQVAGSLGVTAIGVMFFGLLGSGTPQLYGDAFGFTLCLNATLFISAGLLIGLLTD